MLDRLTVYVHYGVNWKAQNIVSACCLTGLCNIFQNVIHKESKQQASSRERMFFYVFYFQIFYYKSFLSSAVWYVICYLNTFLIIFASSSRNSSILRDISWAIKWFMNCSKSRAEQQIFKRTVIDLPLKRNWLKNYILYPKNL